MVLGDHIEGMGGKPSATRAVSQALLIMLRFLF